MLLPKMDGAIAIAPSTDSSFYSSTPQSTQAEALISQSPVLESPAPAIAPDEIPVAQTALLFQNERYSVRVFKEGEQSYINVYDKQSQKQLLDKVPVSIIPATNADKNQTQYIATVGQQQYVVTINPMGKAELSISDGGVVTYRQPAAQVTVARLLPGVSAPAQPAKVDPTRALAKTIFTNFAKLTIFTLMLSMGIRWTFEHVLWLWQRPSLLLRSLMAVIVIVPLLGVLAFMIPSDITVAERIGIGMMLVCPGAPLIPFKSMKAGSHVMFTASLQIALCLMAIGSIPLILMIIANFYPNQAWITPLEVFKQIFFAQVLPLGIGVGIRQVWPKLADEIMQPLVKMATFMLVLVVIVLLTLTLDRVFSIGWTTFLTIVFLTLASLLCGHLLGGPDFDTRLPLANATATRNAGLALLLITMNFPNLDFVRGGIINTLIAYALIAAIVAIPYTVWCKRKMASRVEAHEPMKVTSS
ncbi:MAG TPA: hypothetical protein V6C57_04450 [Coleofasciculaceae cyanobacterium]